MMFARKANQSQDSTTTWRIMVSAERACRRCLRFVLPVAIVVSVLFLGVTSSSAAVSECFGDTGVGLCPIGSNPCEVDTAVTVANHADLNCGTADVVIANGLGKLSVNGSMTLRAHNLTVENTRSIEASASSSDRASITIDLTGSLSLWGQLTARNVGGGSHVTVDADLDVVLETRDGIGIDMVGSGQSNDGGALTLRAGRDIRIGSKIVANGNDGTGSANQNSGGDIILAAGQDIYLEHLLRAYGRWFNGGHLTIDAGGDVELNNDGATSPRRGEVELDGKGIDGDGGILDVRAGGRVLLSGPIGISGGVGNVGGDAQGGELRVQAGCGGVRFEDTVTMLGGLMGGGKVSVESRGNVSVAGTVTLNAQKLGGDGGDVSLRSTMGNVILESSAQIYSNGHVTSNTTEGFGGTVALFGCQVDVSTGALVEANGRSKGRFEASSYKQGTALQNSFGIRISEGADISSYSTGGEIVLRTPTILDGYCSGAPSTPCRLDSECPSSGCSATNCIGGNPQTDGQIVQFSSLPAVEQDDSLGPCAATCQ